MGLFCLLWIPLFYFLRRIASPRKGGGYIWPVLLGCVIVVFQYFFGTLLKPGGFGFFRWLTGFLNIVSFPVIIPLAVCFLLIRLRALPSGADYADFSLLCLMPVAVFRSITWNSPGYPYMLVFVPLLWMAQAVGIPWFLGFISRDSRRQVAVPLSLAVMILPVAATSTWWAFFSQRTLIGWLLLSVTLVPAAISVVSDLLRNY